MSLLTNPWLNIGMGLLANSGPSLTPINPWRGIGQGLMAANEAKAMEQQAAYEQSRMAMEQQKYAAEQQRQAQMQNIIQALPPDQQRLAMADPNAFFDAQIKQQLAKPEPVKQQGTAGDFGVPGIDPSIPGTATFVDGKLAGFDPTEVQAPPAKPSSYQEWDLAGRPGNFEDWVMRRQAAGATKVEMGANDKASPSDVANMIYPDGTQPLPGTPWPEIIAKQGRVLTNEEKAAQTAAGTQSAKNQEAAGKGEALLENYLKAAERYQSGVLPYGSANSQASIARANLVTFYAKNVLGTPGTEPTPQLKQDAEKLIPDFGGPIDAALFGARMSEVRRGIDSALGNKNERKKGQSNSDITIEVVRDPKTGRLVQKQ